MQKQAEDLSSLQETLWSAEDALRQLHLEKVEEGEMASTDADENSGSSLQDDGSAGQLVPQLSLLAASTGDF